MTRENFLFGIIGVLLGFILGFMLHGVMSQRDAELHRFRAEAAQRLGLPKPELLRPAGSSDKR